MKYIGLHFCFIVLLYSFMRFYQGFDIVPAIKTLESSADATHYNTIRNEGYSFNPDYGSNVAFFPGFPYLWKFLGVNVYGICIVNILLFYTGILIWKRYFSPSTSQILLVLSVPSMLFMYMPYSEALFFLSGILLLAGLHKSNMILSFPGFFLSSVSRSVANIFLPAILITFFISRKKITYKTLLIYCTIILGSIGLVAYIQYYQTGYAWGFIQTQKHWQHHLQWPKLPFTSWGQYVWLDAVALFFGLLCVAYSLKLIWRRIKTEIYSKQSSAVIFASLCMAGLTTLTFIMNGGSFFSLNRYLLASPFFAVIYIHFLNSWQFTWRKFSIVFCLMFILFASFHFFVGFRPLLEYFIINCYLCTVLFLKYDNIWIRRLAFLAVYVCNCIMQAHLADRFIRAEWVG